VDNSCPRHNRLGISIPQTALSNSNHGSLLISGRLQIILLLDYLLSEDSVPSNYQLVCDSLSLMERSEKHSNIHAKGTRLIRILSRHAQQKSPPALSQIALMLRDGEASNEQAELQSMENRHNAGVETWDWDSVFFNSFDVTFDGTFLSAVTTSCINCNPR